MSMHKTIIDAVKTAIEGLTGEPTVVIRERLIVLEEEWDSLPLVVLVMGGERTIGGGSEFVIREYEIEANILYAQNQKVMTDIDDAKGWRDTIRKSLVPDRTIAVGSILSGVTAVIDVDAVDMPSQPTQMSEGNYELAVLGLVYRTTEVAHA